MTKFIVTVWFKTEAGNVFTKGYKIQARSESDARAEAEDRATKGVETTALNSLAIAEGLIEE